jgi:hypothetical protein
MSKIRIIFIGDIVGQIGREAVKKILPEFKKKYKPDIIIANAENLAHGKGVTKKTIDEMSKAEIDIFTSGNHIWKNKDVYEILERADSPLIRPANYPSGVPGSGLIEVKIGAKSLFVLNLMGRVFMKEDLDCPLRMADELLKNIDKNNCSGIVVDFHAEATSEKIAMKYYLDGRVSAVLGTHTHVPTADEQIIESGTAYISDVGAVIGKETIIGVGKKEVLKSFLWQIDQAHTIPKDGPVEFNAVYLEIDSASTKATKIQRIQQEINI